MPLGVCLHLCVCLYVSRAVSGIWCSWTNVFLLLNELVEDAKQKKHTVRRIYMTKRRPRATLALQIYETFRQSSAQLEGKLCIFCSNFVPLYTHRLPEPKNTVRSCDSKWFDIQSGKNLHWLRTLQVVTCNTHTQRDLSLWNALTHA